MAKIKQSKLTRAARGEGCTIQLYPYCDGGGETTVFCHAPSEDKGMGLKSPPWWGADGCVECHSLVDGRHHVKDIPPEEIFECFMRGVYRTIKRRIEKGLIKIA